MWQTILNVEPYIYLINSIIHFPQKHLKMMAKRGPKICHCMLNEYSDEI